MTNNEKILLEGIAVSLNDTGNILPSIKWEDVSHEGKLQAIYGLLLPVCINYPSEMKYQLAFQFTNHCYAQKILYSVFNSSSIPMVIIKGFAAAIYYPKPYLRSCGDIDFIVPSELLSQAIKLMEANGYVRTSSHEDEKRHISFSKDGIVYEMHHHFSHTDLDLESYIKEGMRKIEIGKIEGYEIPMLPRLQNGIVLLDHMRNHLKSGLGLRQVVDWMMYCDKVLDDNFWKDEFQPVCEYLGLMTLATTTAGLCQKYLGLKKAITWCKDADDYLIDQLMENLLSSGNFGVKLEGGKQMQTVISFMKKEGIFSYLQSAGEYNWKLYHSHHWLKPLCWLYQILRYIKQGIEHRDKLKESIIRGNGRYELLKKLGI